MYNPYNIDPALENKVYKPASSFKYKTPHFVRGLLLRLDLNQ